MRHDEAAQHRAEQHRQAGERAVDGENAAAPLGRKERGHDGQALRRQDGGPQALRTAREDQLCGIVRKPAEG